MEFNGLFQCTLGVQPADMAFLHPLLGARSKAETLLPAKRIQGTFGDIGDLCYSIAESSSSCKRVEQPNYRKAGNFYPRNRSGPHDYRCNVEISTASFKQMQTRKNCQLHSNRRFKSYQSTPSNQPR
ncbi:hypothetical protein JTE90_006445 [Oedothorax gibbosus]|uniref:Uncharacterized protein n=1 Tax=Oedothorax gibbosus TaxID=931172 RepID=A0AAV6TSE1_9ARAC|nr:hypothetical protein JTE90_006445 [Oedothorax gibbosus]